MHSEGFYFILNYHYNEMMDLILHRLCIFNDKDKKTDFVGRCTEIPALN